MAVEAHPAITKRIEELLLKMKEHIGNNQPTIDLVLRTIEMKDLYGLKNRTADIVDFALRLHSLVSQIEALRALPYDLSPEEPTKKRTSSQTIPAVRPEDEKGK